ncbi:MAG: hypothetical protein FWD74_08530, partial [Actinomycetia bacterium]|nr:hypothetical protein [Actinomycetes bacterium]
MITRNGLRRSTTQRALAALAVLALPLAGAAAVTALGGALAPAANAASDVHYADAAGHDLIAPAATELTGTESTLGPDGWYVCDSATLNYNHTLTVTGDVVLILTDDCVMTVHGTAIGAAGITVTGANSLTIFGQIGGAGSLTATGGASGAGIGGGSGTAAGSITIIGGQITASGGGGGGTPGGGAGIGGGGGSGASGGAGGEITIAGGVVAAHGGDGGNNGGGGAGIGGGGGDQTAADTGGAGGEIIIVGGQVTATGGDGGSNGNGGGGAGIGGGGGDPAVGAAGNITITVDDADLTVSGGHGGAGGLVAAGADVGSGGSTRPHSAAGALPPGGVNNAVDPSKMMTITAAVDGANGQITPSGETQVLRHTTATYTMTPDAGHVIGSILVDGVPQPVSDPASMTYTFANVTAPHTIVVAFATAIVDPDATVTAPATGMPPADTCAGGTGYQCSVLSWSPEAGTFGPNIQYLVSVLLTADPGYSFNGLQTATINDNGAFVSDNTGATVTLTYQFAPTPYTAGISLAPTPWDPSARYGYSTAPTREVTVTNDGNVDTGPLSVTVSGDTADFVVPTDDLDIAVGATASFEVAPILGLDAGVYHVTVVVGPALDNPYTFAAKTLVVTFTVHKLSLAHVTITVSPDTFPYDGGYQEPTVVVTTRDGAVIAESDYDVIYSNNKDAGQASVVVRAKSTSTNVTGSSRAQHFTITPATAQAIDWPSYASIDYDPTTLLNDLAPPDSDLGAFAWVDGGNTNPQVINSGYAMTFCPNATALRDYDWADAPGWSDTDHCATSTVPLTVNPVIDPAYTVPTGLTATYGDTLADVVGLPDNWTNWTWDEPTSELVGPAGAQPHLASYDPHNTNYLTESNVELTVNVAPKQITVTADDEQKYFGEQDPTLTWHTTGLVGTDALTAGSLTYAGAAVGPHDIVAGVPFAGPNYAVQFVKGTMTILPTPSMADVIKAIDSLPDPVKNWADADKVAKATNMFNALPAQQRAQLPQSLQDKLAKAQKQAGRVNHVDGGSTVTGSLPWNIRLVVTPIKTTDPRYTKFAGTVTNKQLLALFDIKLINTLTGKVYEPPAGTSVTVTLG